MTHRTSLAGIGLMVVVTVSLSGCAGRVHLSSKMMCEAHGGTYSAQAKRCAYPAQPPHAERLADLPDAGRGAGSRDGHLRHRRSDEVG